MNSKLKKKNIERELAEELKMQEAAKKRITSLQKKLKETSSEIEEINPIIVKFHSYKEQMNEDCKSTFKEIETKISEIWRFEQDVKTKLEDFSEKNGIPVSFSFVGIDFYYYPKSINKIWSGEELEILKREDLLNRRCENSPGEWSE